MTSNHHRFPDAGWNHGDVVSLRYIRNRPADSIVPARVVADEPSFVALYYGPGSPRVVHATADGEPLPRAIPFIEREQRIGGLRQITWTDRHVLQIQEPDRMSAVLLWWDENWTFLGYYVNLQASLTRTSHGFDTADYLLDIVVHPDLAWEWKDEEEFALARFHDILSEELADAVRAEGHRAIGDIEARRWPFDCRFESWRPDPAWQVPSLPAGWDEGLL